MSDTVTLDQHWQRLGDAMAEPLANVLKEGEIQAGRVEAVGEAERDKFVIGMTAWNLAYKREHSVATTLTMAGEELERVIDLATEGKANASRREYASSVREERYGHTRRILNSVLEDPAIQDYWREREHYKRPPKLTIPEERDLRRLIAKHFAELPTATLEGLREPLQQARVHFQLKGAHPVPGR